MTQGKKAATCWLHVCAGKDRLRMQFDCAASNMLPHRDSHMHEIVQSFEFGTSEGLAVNNAKTLADFSPRPWLI